jgi:hypothetical protein
VAPTYPIVCTESDRANISYEPRIAEPRFRKFRRARARAARLRDKRDIKSLLRDFDRDTRYTMQTAPLKPPFKQQKLFPRRFLEQKVSRGGRIKFISPIIRSARVSVLANIACFMHAIKRVAYQNTSYRSAE